VASQLLPAQPDLNGGGVRLCCDAGGPGDPVLRNALAPDSPNRVEWSSSGLPPAHFNMLHVNSLSHAYSVLIPMQCGTTR